MNMKELKAKIVARIENYNKAHESAGDRRDWDSSSNCEIAIHELNWVLGHIDYINYKG